MYVHNQRCVCEITLVAKICEFEVQNNNKHRMKTSWTGAFMLVSEPYQASLSDCCVLYMCYQIHTAGRVEEALSNYSIKYINGQL